MNEDEKQWILDNIKTINANTNDIDELCCALEQSTIFAMDYIQTFATKLLYLDYKYKSLQQRIDKATEYIENKDAIINTDVIRIFDLLEIEKQGYINKLLSILKGENNGKQ